MIFPSPGGQPLAPPVAVEKPVSHPKVVPHPPGLDTGGGRCRGAPGRRDRVRHRRSGSGAPRVATDSDRSAGGITTMAAGATTAAPSHQVAGAAATVDERRGHDHRRLSPPALRPPSKPPSTFAATQDRKSHDQRAGRRTQVPAYVSFRAPLPVGEPPSTRHSTSTTAGAASTAARRDADTTGVAATETTARLASRDNDSADDALTVGTVSPDQATNIVQQITGFTGLAAPRPVDVAGRAHLRGVPASHRMRKNWSTWSAPSASRSALS